MNIRICEDPACADIEVVVRCRQLDDTVLSLLARLRVYDAKLTGERDGATYVLARRTKRRFFIQRTPYMKRPCACTNWRSSLPRGILCARVNRCC